MPIPAPVVWLLVSEILLCMACFAWPLVAAAEVPNLYFSDEGGWVRVIVATTIVILATYFHDLYGTFRVNRFSFLFAQFCTIIGIGILFQALLTYVQYDWILPRAQMLMGSATALVVLPLYRLIYSHLAINYFGNQKLLFLGENELITEIGRQIKEHPEKGYCSLGYLSEHPTPELDELLGKCLGVPSDVDPLVKEHKPFSVIVGLKERRGKLPVYPLMDLRLLGHHIQDVSLLHESLSGKLSILTLRPSQLVFSDELGPKPGQVAVKEVSSFIIAALALVLAGPIMLLVALAVKLTSPGPALYSQKRVGFNGKVFRVYKFRSMRADAEAVTGAVWAKKDDPRVTPLGKWLRLLRIDELPQIFNVLRGEMSIVGPRPERPEFVKTLSEQIPFYAQRHFVKPGITGWAQINHKYGDTVEDTITKLEYDLYYIKHLSPALDAYIIFHTVKVMLLSRGSQ